MDLKIKDVAELLNLSEKTVRRWLKEGLIPAYRINQQYRFSRIEIENWVMSCKLDQGKGSPFVEQKPPTPEQLRGGMQQFSLYRAVHQGGVFSDIEGETKEEVIRTASQVLAPLFGLDGEILTELLLDREELMPTALNNGIAVPHTREVALKRGRDAIAIVFPKQPIEYGALDGKPVHVLFFLFSSGDKRHLHLLAKLAHLSTNEKALELFRTRASKEKILDYVKEWESHIRQRAE